MRYDFDGRFRIELDIWRDTHESPLEDGDVFRSYELGGKHWSLTLYDGGVEVLRISDKEVVLGTNRDGKDGFAVLQELVERANRPEETP